MFQRGLALFGAVTLAACANSYGRPSLPPSEAHYARTLSHELARDAAFERALRGLEKSYDDWPKVLTLKVPGAGTLQVESTAGYRTGGPMGPDRHSKYTLKVVVKDHAIDLAFDLGSEVETPEFAPEAAIPYIRFHFDEVVENVESALGAR